MKRQTPIDRDSAWMTLFFIMLSVVLAFICVWQALVAGEGHITCSSPVPYSEKLSAFYAGSRGLDGDGDGVPCENSK